MASILPGQYDAHADQQRAAVAAERERCAKIADAQAALCDASPRIPVTIYAAAECRAIAVKIRKEPQ